MSQRFLLGLDLGGGGIRALLAGVEDGDVHLASRAWHLAANPSVPMSVEFDPDEAWRQLAEAVREVCASAGVTADRISGIATTSMRHGSVVVDAAGEVVLATPNRDARGAIAMLAIAAEHGELLHARTGHWPNSIMPAGRLRWMADEAPDLLERAAAHLSLDDWVSFRLCGEQVTTPSQAAEAPLIDLATRDFAADLIETLSLPALFPDIAESGTALGTLRADAAAHLGLREGTPVSVGGADTQCGLLGAGVLEPGELCVVAGTSAPLQRVIDTPLLDPRLWTSHHLRPGHFTLESNAGGAGEALVWLAGVLYADAPHPLLALLHDAARSNPGAVGMLSTFGPQIMDARALGLPLGNLSLSPIVAADDPDRRRHVARAVVEGLVFGLRANADQIAAVSGELPDTLRMTGGLSRSPLLTQLFSDVTGRAVEVPEVSHATALGAAICAGVGAGVFDDLAEGAKALVRITRTHAPDDAAAATYAEIYPVWCDVRAKAAEADATAATLAMRHLGMAPTASGAASAASRPRILVAADLDETSLEALRQLGEVEYASYRQAMRMLTGPSLVEALRGFQVFVTEIDVVGADALLECPDLRAIVCCRGDAVNIDLEACTALGIPVMNTPGRNADAVADLALGLLLMLARKLVEANAFLREPGGEPGDMGRMGRAFGALQGSELWQKTVGLVGLGAVGRKVVERLRPFGARCLVHDPFLDDDAVRLAGAEPASLETLLAESDFVSLHAAVTDDSRGLIGAAEIARMKPGSFLVNTARAALIDQDALHAALESGHLGGAALDVFAVEPPGSDDPILALSNVLATPHVGGNTRDVAAHQGRIAAEEIARLLRGERPLHLLDPAALDDFSWTDARPHPPADLRERLAGRAGPAVTDLQKEKEEDAKGAPAPVAVAASTSPEVTAARARFEAVLQCFVDGIVADDGLSEHASNADDVVLHFVLPDIGSELHVGFADGAPLAALGAPSPAAPVQLKMKADLFDGMFTGRRNAMQAAMDGELSFSGDAAKAMTLQQIQKHLERLYRAAREQAGDPGDLTAIPDPNAPATGTTPAPSAPATDVRHELIRVTNELFEQQLITATGGNVSVRSDDDPDEAWITPSQLFKGDLSVEVLVRIGMDGRAILDGTRSPSSEAPMHTAVLKAKPEARAVIHCHAPNATILANTDLPFLPISTEAAFFQNLGRVPFIMPGSQQLAEAIVEAMGEGWAVLMQNHGLLVAGRSLRRAADMAEIIERTCEVILGCYAVGKEPPTLPAETVEMLSKYGDLMA